MRPFLVPMEIETDLKYSKINNFFVKYVRVYVPGSTQPLIEERERCYCFVIVPLFRFFFAA